MSFLTRSSAALVALTGAIAPATSRAAPPTEEALERARHLFALAEADEDGERWSDALDKLRAVSQVKLTAGVRYHLALCEEHVGQLARAYAEYQAAATQAQTESAADVTRLVGTQLSALEPRVPRLTIHVVPAVPDVSLKLDGEPVAAPPANAAIALDPGLHRIEAWAPDRPRSTTVVTVQESESRVLDIYLGEPVSSHAGGSGTAAPSPVLASHTRTAPETSNSHHLAIAAAVTGAGLAAGGAVAFLVAGSEHGRAVSACAQDFSIQPDACSGLVLRVRAWDFAAAAAWAGALMSESVAIVLWAKPHDATTHVRAELLVGPGTIGAWGRF